MGLTLFKRRNSREFPPKTKGEVTLQNEEIVFAIILPFLGLLLGRRWEARPAEERGARFQPRLSFPLLQQGQVTHANTAGPLNNSAASLPPRPPIFLKATVTAPLPPLPIPPLLFFFFLARSRSLQYPPSKRATAAEQPENTPREKGKGEAASTGLSSRPGNPSRAAARPPPPPPGQQCGPKRGPAAAMLPTPGATEEPAPGEAVRASVPPPGPLLPPPAAVPERRLAGAIAGPSEPPSPSAVRPAPLLRKRAHPRERQRPAAHTDCVTASRRDDPGGARARRRGEGPGWRLGARPARRAAPRAGRPLGEGRGPGAILAEAGGGRAGREGRHLAAGPSCCSRGGVSSLVPSGCRRRAARPSPPPRNDS